MTRISYILILLLALSVYKLNAQGQLVFDQYIEGKQYYNPAAVGIGNNNKFNIIALYHRELLKKGKIANTGIVLANMPIYFIGHKNVIGFELNTYKATELQSTELSSSYSWVEVIGKIQINIAGGIIFRNTVIDYSKIQSSNDSITKGIIPRSNIKGKGVDLSMGIFINGYNTFLGVSTRNILNKEIVLSDYYRSPMTRYYNLILGYNIMFSNFIFTPSTLFTINDKLSYRADFNLSSSYKQKFALNIGYRYKDSFLIGLDTKLLNFKIGYSLRIPKGQISHISNWGTHEFFVSYALDINKNRNKRNVFESIRLL